MLQNVHVQVRSRIKEVDSDYDTLLLEKEAAFAVSKSQKDAEAGLFCYVTFTSTALRKSPEEVPKEEEEEGKEEEPKADGTEDGLPLDKCLQALAELRHSRWFTTMAASLPSCVECIRIMRDLAHRDPVWSSLSDWAIELLVERSLYSAWRPLNPAASLMRVMEVIVPFLNDEWKLMMINIPLNLSI